MDSAANTTATQTDISHEQKIPLFTAELYLRNRLRIHFLFCDQHCLIQNMENCSDKEITVTCMHAAVFNAAEPSSSEIMEDILPSPHKSERK